MVITEGQDVNMRHEKNGSLAAPNDDSPKMKNISKLREAIPQIFAVSAKNLLLVTFGTTLGFPTIFLAALQSDNPDIIATREQITWMSSINLFMVPVGCLFSGPISHHFGRKRTMLLANIPFMAAWLMLHFATTVPLVFVALALTGLTGGLCEAPILTYVAEITQPHLRGMLSATSSMSVIGGVFVQLLCGSLTDWRTMTLLNLIYPVVCFLTLLMMPESPYWLAGKDRFSDAERSLQWLRGWTTPSHVREELQTVCQLVKPTPVGDDAKKESRWHDFGKRTFIAPFFLTIFAFAIASFGGAATLQTYAVFIFKNMKAPIDQYTATMFLGIVEIVGTGLCVMAIHFTGKRWLTFISITGTGTLFLGSAIYGYVIKYNNIDVDAYSWLATLFLIGAAFFAHIGIRLLPWILCGEVFPASVRSGASGAAAACSYIFSSIANKSFLYMVDAMDLSGTFLFNAAVNLVGGITLFILLPETEGKTLKEIVDHYAGVKSLNSKSQTKKIEMKERWAAANPGLVNDDLESKL